MPGIEAIVSGIDSKQVCIDSKEDCIASMHVSIDSMQDCIDPMQVSAASMQVCADPMQICIAPPQRCIESPITLLEPAPMTFESRLIGSDRMMRTPTPAADHRGKSEHIACSADRKSLKTHGKRNENAFEPVCPPGGQGNGLRYLTSS